MLFREFQENNLDPHINSDLFDSRLIDEFNNLFKIHQIDVEIKKTDIYINLKRLEKKGFAEVDNKRVRVQGQEAIQEFADRGVKSLTLENLEVEDAKRIPFDLIFTKYIF